VTQYADVTDAATHQCEILDGGMIVVTPTWQCSPMASRYILSLVNRLDIGSPTYDPCLAAAADKFHRGALPTGPIVVMLGESQQPAVLPMVFDILLPAGASLMVGEALNTCNAMCRWTEALRPGRGLRSRC
jgi:hypothetical protein